MRIVCYHYPCPDGVFAALAAHLASRAKGWTLRWVPLTVFRAPCVQELNVTGSDTVFFLDYTGPTGFPEAVAQHASQVVVLDHHKTAHEALVGRDDLPPNMAVTVDMGRSGATIALDWFEPPNPSEDMVKKFKYIEDADLWRWALPDSKAFHEGLRSLALEYDANKNPGIFDTLCGLSCSHIIETGKAAMARQAVVLDRALSQKRVVQLGGEEGVARGWGRCYAVDLRETDAQLELTALRSELGNALAEQSLAAGLEPLGVVAYSEAGIGDDTRLKVSLRGVGSAVDTTVVTQAFGGGGHAKASSCIVGVDLFERWLLS